MAVYFASWLVNQTYFSILKLFKREIIFKKIHYMQTEKVMKFFWYWSNFTPLKAKLHPLIISNHLVINSSLSQPNCESFYFLFSLSHWITGVNTQTSTEVIVRLDGWGWTWQKNIVTATTIRFLEDQKTSVCLGVFGNRTLIYLREVFCYPNGTW